jgi:hypothetical protein
MDTIPYVLIYSRKSAKVMGRLSFRATKNLIEKTDTKQSNNKNEYSKFITTKFQEIFSAFLRAVYGISVSLNTRNVVCDVNDIEACLTPIKTMKLGVSLHR